MTKDLARLSTGTSTLELWARLHGLQARWDTQSFEQMARAAHFFSLFLGVWSSPGTHVSWVTDDDSIVANAGRLEDAHQLAARLSILYVSHHLGEFMMNTVAVDTGDRGFEDFVAVSDLAAGILTEVMSGTAAEPASGELGVLRKKELSDKSDVIPTSFGIALVV